MIDQRMLGRRRTPTLLLVIATVSAACGTSSSAESGERAPSGRVYGPRHPIPESLYHPAKIAGEVTINSPPSAGFTGLPLTTAHIVTKVGRLEGPEEYLFSKVTAVALDDDNRIFVLDGGHRTVRVFDRNGKFVTSFGHPGQGAGGFRQPADIAVTKGMVFVSDVKTIHAFKVSGKSFVFSHGLPVGGEPFDICANGGKIFAHTANESPDSLIAQVDSAGIQRSFGKLFSGLPPVAYFHLNRGRLACSQDKRTIVFGPRSVLGELRGFNTEGEPLWVVNLLGYRPIQFQVSSTQRGSRTIIPEEGYDRLGSLEYAGNGFFIAQIPYTSMEESKRRQKAYTSLFTLAVSEEGNAWSLGNQIPFIAAFGKRSFLVVSHSRMPEVALYEW